MSAGVDRFAICEGITMKWIKIILYIPTVFLMAAVLLLGKPILAFAQEATVTFGSDSYTGEDSRQFRVGVYINGESKIGTYYVEIEYDSERLLYLGGGDSEQDGVIILKGTGLQERVKYMLHFQPIGGGEAGIFVRSASVQTTVESGGEDFIMEMLGSAPITIAGADETGISFFDRVAAAQEIEQELTEEEPAEESPADNNFGVDTEIPLLAAIDMEDGKRYYIVDHEQYIPASVAWKYHKVSGYYGTQSLTFLTNDEEMIKLLYLMDAEENFYPYACSEKDKCLYTCHATVSNETAYLYMSPYACDPWPVELTIQAIEEEYVFFAMDSGGNGEFYQFDADGNLNVWNPEESEAANSGQIKKIICIFAVVGVALIVACILAYRATVVLKRQRRKKRQKLLMYQKLQERLNRQEKEEQEFDFPMEELLYPEEELSNDSAVQEETPTSKEAESTVELPVISVQDVTMVFHISNSNASGIKEYFIQRLKHQVSSRELMALDHINFDVFKGEVVGIIGTNGSGKSTLLRIVSGALSPSDGQVVVDRSKVQLLTLGTGFDMELTARENVYLNGSIIGYSKQFIDEHFNEIVQFAELQQFMDEKVKNYSSGMVSRLGFSIATAGAAAEILILDEVLSVGDEFFRKKSLKRIKEMIHSGSTVLIVSHGMATILDNCSKAVWIEKGKLQMVGEAKVVCQKYREVGNAG